MDKIKAKIEIEKLKQSLIKLKAFHKSANENNKSQLDGLKKSASIQTTTSAKQNAKLRVESKKQTIISVKNTQANEIKRIQDQIEKIKKSIK
jgi:hypothetical protein